MKQEKIKVAVSACSRPYILLPAVALVIALLVLFIPPYPGVSDHGDFERILAAAGLRADQAALDAGSKGFVHTVFYNAGFPLWSLLQIMPASSIIYPITLSRVAFLPYFSTHVLSVVLVLLYAFAFFIFLRAVDRLSHKLTWFLGIVGIFILFDAGYLVWTNSLYQEAVMFIGLFLFFAITAYFLASGQKLKVWHVLVFTAATIFFMLSKAQVISTLPIIGLIFGILCFRRAGSKAARIAVIAGLCVLLVVTGRFYGNQRDAQGKCTTYQSLFYGLLMNSPTPEQDMAELGLSPALQADIGKHAFLPEEDYFCPPYSEMADEMIYSKVGTFDVVRFYLRHPARLLQEMQYTADNVFRTGDFLGKYEQYQVPERQDTIGRFTLYSDLRAKLPKNFFAQLSIFLVGMLFALTALWKGKGRGIKILAGLLSITLFICAVQYPLPVLGNGHADTWKQVFLFNYSFDLSVLFFAGTVFLWVQNFILKKKSKQPQAEI